MADPRPTPASAGSNLVKIQAKTKDHPTPVEATYDFGKPGLEGLVARFGGDVVESRARAALVIDIQALMRRHIDGEKDGKSTFNLQEMQKNVAEWKPTVSNGVRRSASERIEETVAKMSDADRQALLEKLQAQIRAGAGGQTPPPAGKPATRPGARQ